MGSSRAEFWFVLGFILCGTLTSIAAYLLAPAAWSLPARHAVGFAGMWAGGLPFARRSFLRDFSGVQCYGSCALSTMLVWLLAQWQ